MFCACWSSENVALVRWLLDHGAAATDACLPAALGHLQRHNRGAYDIAEALLGFGLAVDQGAKAPPATINNDVADLIEVQADAEREALLDLKA